MAKARRIVWHEGMTLDPHHFQRWDLFHQSLLNFRIRTIAHCDWGLTSLDIDADALTNGQVRLTRICGVMRDGTPFDMPDTDPLPPARGLEKFFSATDDSLGIFLAIPIEPASGRSCHLDDSPTGRPVRFIREFLNVNDVNTGADERQISVARSNFTLIFGPEPREEFVSLKIGEIVRGSDGKFSMSGKYVPSCLLIGASETMLQMLQRLLELLIAKTNALNDRRHQQPSGQIEFTTSDIKTFWLLHTLNTFIPQLNYALTNQQCHPEQMFLLLLSLAGQLTTFSSDTTLNIRDLPLYDHNDPSHGFIELDSIIQRLLNEAITTNSIVIPLEVKNESIHVGRVVDPLLLRTAQFFLMVSGDIPERKVVDEFRLKAKIASPENINMVISTSTNALQFSHSARPPVGMPSKPGLQYFRLDKAGVYWDAIVKSSAIAIFVPGEFRTLKLGLVAVKEPE